MHNMKKVWAVLLAGVLAAGTLAGCGGGDGETQVATPGSDGSVSVSTEAGGAGEDGGSGAGFERAAALVVLRRGRGVGKNRREVVKPMAGSTLGCGVGTARGLAAELVAEGRRGGSWWSTRKSGARHVPHLLDEAEEEARMERC